MADLFFIFGAQYLFILSLAELAIFLYQSREIGRKKMIIFIFLSFALAFVASLIARELYFNPRPFVSGGFEPLLAHEPDNGFPSDHTLLVAAIASVVTFFHKRTALYLWLIAAVVGLSRVYVGVHHLEDVLASAVIALLSTYLVYKALKLKEVL